MSVGDGCVGTNDVRSVVEEAWEVSVNMFPPPLLTSDVMLEVLRASRSECSLMADISATSV